jgi:hypothetical protein
MSAETPPPTEALVPMSPSGQPNEPSCQRTRNGHVARLPKTVRDQLNQMLLDGVPYLQIIEKLGDVAKHLKEDSISEWKKGGYPEWLLEIRRADDLAATRDAALTLVSQKAGGTVQDAGRTVASAQLYELLLSFDPRAFAEALVDKPELYLRLINSLSRLSEGEAVCSRRRAHGSLIEGELTAAQNGEGAAVISADKLNQILRLIKLL